MGSGLSTNIQKWYSLEALCRTNANCFLIEIKHCNSTVLNMVVNNCTLLVVACRYQPSVVSSLLNNKKITCETINMVLGGYNALFVACKYQPDAVVWLLNHERFADSSINATLLDQVNALHIACFSNNHNAVKYLLESDRFWKSSVNMLKNNEWGALHGAIVSREKRGAEYLLSSNKFSRDILNSTIGLQQSNMFLYACRHSPEIACRMLSYDELTTETINARDGYEKLNALHIACKKNSRDLVYCLSYQDKFTDENINGVDINGFNALFHACNSYESDVELIHWLLTHCRFSQSSIEHRTNKGVSIIEHACAHANITVVKYLLDSDKISQEFVRSHNFSNWIFEYESVIENMRQTYYNNSWKIRQRFIIENIVMNHPKYSDNCTNVNNAIIEQSIWVEELEKKFFKLEKDLKKLKPEENMFETQY